MAAVFIVVQGFEGAHGVVRIARHVHRILLAGTLHSRTYGCRSATVAVVLGAHLLGFPLVHLIGDQYFSHHWLHGNLGGPVFIGCGVLTSLSFQSAGSGEASVGLMVSRQGVPGVELLLNGLLLVCRVPVRTRCTQWARDTTVEVVERST